MKGILLSSAAADNPLAAAFDLGMRLNELQWHVLQTGICGSKRHYEAACSMLEQIELLSVALYPLHRGGQVRRLITDWRRRWDGWLDNDWLQELGAGIYSALNQGSISVEEAISELSALVPDIAEDIRRKLVHDFKAKRAMLTAFRLGQCVDEGQHVPLRPETLIFCEEVPKRRIAQRHTRCKKARTCYCVRRPVHSGDIAPSTDWIGELQLLWRKAGLVLTCPTIGVADLMMPDKRRYFIKRLIVLVHRSLAKSEHSRLAKQSASNDGSDQSAPAEPALAEPVAEIINGWRFTANGAVFEATGTKVPVSGKLRSLLNVLASARFYHNWATLRTEVWEGDAACDEKNIRTHLAKLRQRLRDAFALPKTVDPIPTKDGIRLDWKVLEAAKEAQN
jgi:hypothetical protein